VDNRIPKQKSMFRLGIISLRLGKAEFRLGYIIPIESHERGVAS